MDNHFLLRQAVLTGLALIFIVLLFEFSSLDMWIQGWLYHPAADAWVLEKHSEVLKLLFYDGPKGLLILMAIMTVPALVICARKEALRIYCPGLVTVLLTIVVTVVLVGWLKAVTNVPCPKDLQYFGGVYPYSTFMHHLPFAAGLKPVRCFPAGHASGGFALLSLFFLFRQPRNRWIGFGAGMALGWVLGIYKMLIGDHFLSHTLVTMSLAWLVSIAMAAGVYNYAAIRTATSAAIRRAMLSA